MVKKLLFVIHFYLLLSTASGFVNAKGNELKYVGFGNFTQSGFTLSGKGATGQVYNLNTTDIRSIENQIIQNELFTSDFFDDFSSEAKRRKSSRKRKSSSRGGKDYENFLVTLSGGIGIPLGDFAKPMDVGSSSSISDPSGTFSDKDDLEISTQIGFLFNGSFTYRFIKYLGAEALIGGQFHSLPSYTSSTSVESELGYYTDATNTVESTSWKIWNFMAGAHGFLPISDGNKITLEGRALIGLSSCATPQSTITIKSSSNMALNINIDDETIPSMSATSFSYMFGIGCRYNISDIIGVSLFVDYFATNPTFEIDLGNLANDILGGGLGGDIPGFTMPSMKTKYTQNISTLNFTLGFNIRF